MAAPHGAPVVDHKLLETQGLLGMLDLVQISAS